MKLLNKIKKLIIMKIDKKEEQFLRNKNMKENMINLKFNKDIKNKTIFHKMNN